MVAQEPGAEVVRQELEKILASPGFARNERLSRFLRFVVEHQLQGTGRHLKESTVAVEVFGRKPDYDPKVDSIVRTEAARLRTRLAEYYRDNEGSNGLIIDLPKGGYAPIFTLAQAPASQPQPAGIRSIPWGKTAAGIAALIVLAGISLRFATHRVTAPVIAVLPIHNLSNHPNNEFFADGLTDEIIRNLSVIEGLDVRSRTSSFVFKDKPRNVREVGQQLGADYLIEGSMLSWDSSIRINIQLVRVSTDIPVWSRRFDRDMEDVFVIQDEIALAVVNELRLKLGRGKRRYTTNTEAYSLYLKARSLLVPAKPKEAIQSIELFQQVTARDPGFALAYAGLASAHAVNSMNVAGIPSREAYPLIRAAAREAIRLDPLLAEAHSALGLVHCRDRDWRAAESEFRRAIELDPSFTQSYLDLAYWVLYPAGRVDEALLEIDRALKVDPLSLPAARAKAWVLMNTGRTDEVIRICRRILSENPESPLVNGILGRALVQHGRAQDAVAILTQPNQLLGPFLAYAYVAAGRLKDAEALVAENQAYPSRLVHIHAALRDKDGTLQSLERMAQLEQPLATVFTVYPELAFLWPDPQFQAFRRKLGLPGEVLQK